MFFFKHEVRHVGAWQNVRLFITFDINKGLVYRIDLFTWILDSIWPARLSLVTDSVTHVMVMRCVWYLFWYYHIDTRRQNSLKNHKPANYVCVANMSNCVQTCLTVTFFIINFLTKLENGVSQGVTSERYRVWEGLRCRMYMRSRVLIHWTLSISFTPRAKMVAGLVLCSAIMISYFQPKRSDTMTLCRAIIYNALHRNKKLKQAKVFTFNGIGDCLVVWATG